MVGIQVIGSGTHGTGSVATTSGGVVVQSNGTTLGAYANLNFERAYSYQYWQFSFTKPTGQTIVGLSGIQFVNNGQILNPLNGPFASTDYTVFSIPQAFDGSQSTFWASTGLDTTPYIGWAFTSQTAITSIVVYPRNDGYASIQAPLQIIVQGSNDYQTYTTLTTFTPASWVAGTGQTITVSGNYLVYRLLLTQPSTNQNTALSEIQFFNGATQISLSQTIYGPSGSSDASLTNNGNFSLTVPQAFQGNGYWWQSSGSDSTPYIQYCFIVPTYVSSISLYSTNDSNYARGPSQIIVQGSNNGTTFTNVSTFTPATWVQGVSQTISGFSGTFIFWRLACTINSSAGQSNVSLGNIVFYNGSTPYSYPLYSSENNNYTSCQFNAFDGHFYNNWASSTSDSSPYLQYSFPAPQAITNINFLSFYSSSGSTPISPSAITISVSNNGINFIPLSVLSSIIWITNYPYQVFFDTFAYQVYGGTLTTQQIAHGASNVYSLTDTIVLNTFGTTSYSYWKFLLGQGSGGGGYIAFDNIAFYNSSGNLITLSGGTSTASSSFSSSYPPSNVFSNNSSLNTSIFWASANGDVSCYLQYQFPSAVSVSEIAFFARADYPQQGPSTIAILGSNDGTNYTTFVSSFVCATWASGVGQYVFANTNYAIDSVASQNGTYVLPATNATSLVSNETQSAYLNQGYLTLPFANLPTNSTSGVFSFELVFSISGIATSGAVLLYNSNTINYNNGFMIVTTSATSNPVSYSLYLYFSTSGRIIIPLSSIYLNATYLLSVTYDTANVRVYLNGNLIAVNSASGTLATAQYGNIILGNGLNYASNYYQTGSFQNLSFYKSVLTPQQILSHYFAIKYSDTVVSGSSYTIDLINTNPFDIDFYVPGFPGTFQQIVRFVMTRTSIINFAYISTGTTSTYISNFTIEKNSSPIGTLSVGAGFSTASAVITTSFVAGDILTVNAPSVPDPTISNISISFSGTR